MAAPPDEVPRGFSLRHVLRREDGLTGRMAWSPNGATLASPNANGTVSLWNTGMGAFERYLVGDPKTPALGVTWSADGRYIAWGTVNGSVFVRDGTLGGSPREIRVGRGPVSALAWSAGRPTLAIGMEDGDIRLWNDRPAAAPPREMGKHDEAVNSFAWSEHGRWLVSGSSDGMLRSAHVERDDDRGFFGSVNGGVTSLAFLHPSVVTAASTKGTIDLWDPAKAERIKTIQAHEGPATSVSISSDGRLLASKGLDSRVRLWRCDTWEQVSELPEPSGDKTLASLAFHPKEPVLATLGENDTVIRIWDLDVGELLSRTTRAVKSVPLTVSALPEMSAATQRGVKYAARFAESANKPIDSVLLLAGFLHVRRRSKRRDTTHFLSEYLKDHHPSSPADASPVTLLGLTDRYGITRLPKQLGAVPAASQFDEDGLRALAVASEVAKEVSNRERVGARHLIAAILKPVDPPATPFRGQEVLRDTPYNLDDLRQAFLDAMRRFNLPDDDQDAWERWLLRPGPGPLGERFALEIKATPDVWTLEDRLGYQAYAEAIAQPILEGKTKPPLTIAIQARWGQGKSSLMGMIREKLDGKRPEPRKAKRAKPDEIPNQKATPTVPAATVGESRQGSSEHRAIDEDRLSHRVGELLKRFVADKTAENTAKRLRRFDRVFEWSTPSGRRRRRAAAQPATMTFGQLLKSAKRDPRKDGTNMLDVPSDSATTVWFNPLFYRSADQVWAGLAYAMLTELADRFPTALRREEFWLRLRLKRLDRGAIRRDFHNFVLGNFLPKGALYLVALLVFVVLYVFSLLDTGEVSLLGVGSVVAGLAHLLLDRELTKHLELTDKFREYVNEPDYAAKRGYLQIVTEDLDKALELLVGESLVVVFIDDLDRCPPETVSQVILAINQFLSVSVGNCRVIFILGVDMQMVANSLDASQGKWLAAEGEANQQGKSFGWRFMQKFVQLPFLIPRLDAQMSQDFVRSHVVTPGVAAPTPSAKPVAVDVETPKDTGADLTPNKVAAITREGVEAIEREQDPDKVLAQYTARKDRVDSAGRSQLEAAIVRKRLRQWEDPESKVAAKFVECAMTDLDYNPRAIKRFLNLARLLFSLSGTRVQGKSEDELILTVVRCAHLILNWPQVVMWLQRGDQQHDLSGKAQNPAKFLLKLAENAENYKDWHKSIETTWGHPVDPRAFDPNLYEFIKRTANPDKDGNSATLVDLYHARLF